jgi:catechol 2,3-dioxygenase-like lactoylglutathione lyase family enzyme
MALQLNHYSVRTVDLERTRRFYTKVLGLTVGELLLPPRSAPTGRRRSS